MPTHPLSPLQAGAWLGIDIGSGRNKVCSFCLITSDGEGDVAVTFEKGPAEAPYPEKNTFAALIDPTRPPTYLRTEIEATVCKVIRHSQLVTRWLETVDQPGATAVAIDAPVALASPGQVLRQTEAACTQTFRTPNRATFESHLDGQQKPGFYNSNTFWKCIGFTVYRHLAARLKTDLSPAALAAATCAQPVTGWRLRETFPSDVYKRADGTEGILANAGKATLRHLVAPGVDWRAEPGVVKPVLTRLQGIRQRLHGDLEVGGALASMQKLTSVTGDLWDAFTCAFAVCAEDHGGGHFRGWDRHSEASERLRREGAILTVATAG